MLILSIYYSAGHANDGRTVPNRLKKSESRCHNAATFERVTPQQRSGVRVSRPAEKQG